jgi:hypothetical protein
MYGTAQPFRKDALGIREANYEFFSLLPFWEKGRG